MAMPAEKPEFYGGFKGDAGRFGKSFRQERHGDESFSCPASRAKRRPSLSFGG